MSPEALSAQRLYGDIRDAIMTGAFRPGEVLVTSHIAERFGTSVSPVRDVLHQLLGEGLIQAQSIGGFYVPALAPRGIGHLYRWQAELTYLVARSAPGLETISDPLDPGLSHGRKAGVLTPVEIAHGCSRLFHALAGISDNPEHHLAFARLDARLHLVRCHEAVLGRCQGELVSLWGHLRSGNRHRARTALWHYHRRRLLNLERIFAALVAAGHARASAHEI
ncbi:GntR family transcriptional regulator [Sphingobium yanoikuyae]|nr:GntR family transcriptional regulator [Sphingobium yanoikuyae]